MSINQLEDLWDVLHSTLDELPQRNYLYLCGDFNTNVTRSADVFGQCYFISQQGPCRGTQTQDAERFHKLMEQSSLLALNSWNARMPPTFTAPWGCSRIDFIFTRRLAADLSSRNVAILDHMPLVPCSGPRHHPVLACVPRNWNFYNQTITAEWTFSRRREIFERWQHDSNTWRQYLERTIGDQFTALIQQPADNMEAMHHDLNHAAPAIPGQRSKIQAHGSHTLFQHFWTLTRRFKQLRLEQFVQAGRCCLKVWKICQQRQKLRSQMKTHSKFSRKNKIKSVMERAQKAADSKDHYEFFKHIRQLAPKSPFKRIILRDDDGGLLGPH